MDQDNEAANGYLEFEEIGNGLVGGGEGAVEVEIEVKKGGLDADIAKEKALEVLVALFGVDHAVAAAVAAMDVGAGGVSNEGVAGLD